jgi:hypothetical protein
MMYKYFAAASTARFAGQLRSYALRLCTQSASTAVIAECVRCDVVTCQSSFRRLHCKELQCGDALNDGVVG